MKAARILQVLGLLGLVVAVVVAVFNNCRHRHPGRSFFLEGITGLSGTAQLPTYVALHEVT